MKISCISYPERDPLVIIRKSQIEFCDGNVCAAALLSFFEYWHNMKLEMVPKAAALNNLAVAHGEAGFHDESLFQFHKMEDLSSGIMGIYGREAIKVARALLKEKGVLTEHRNPTQRYQFDNTVYFLFHPEIVCEWLYTRYNQNQSHRHAENGLSMKPKPVTSTRQKPSDGPTDLVGRSYQNCPIYSTEITAEITKESLKTYSSDVEKKPAKPKAKTKKAEAAPVKAKITPDWMPSARCLELISQAGIDESFALSLVGAFILYWDEEETKKSAWDSTFLNHVKNRWERKSRQPVNNNSRFQNNDDTGYQPTPAAQFTTLKHDSDFNTIEGESRRLQ